MLILNRLIAEVVCCLLTEEKILNLCFIDRLQFTAANKLLKKKIVIIKTGTIFKSFNNLFTGCSFIFLNCCSGINL